MSVVQRHSNYVAIIYCAHAWKLRLMIACRSDLEAGQDSIDLISQCDNIVNPHGRSCNYM